MIDDLRRILRSMAEELGRNGVIVVTGDTKVVPRGQADGIFITTSGIGSIGNSRGSRCGNTGSQGGA